MHLFWCKFLDKKAKSYLFVNFSASFSPKITRNLLIISCTFFGASFLDKMNTIKKVVRKQVVKSEYFNIETGESMASEMANSYVVQETDMVIVNYKSFIIVNREVMSFLEEVLPFAEIGRINKLCRSIKTNLNVLHNNKTNKPYTDEELATDIQYTRNKFYDFMQKMLKAGIVYNLVSYYGGVKKIYIVLNPHLAKATKTTDVKLLEYFEDISTEKVQKKVREIIKEIDEAKKRTTKKF